MSDQRRGTAQLFRPRWRVVVRYRHYKDGKIRGESNFSQVFFFRRNAKRWARDREQMPGMVARIERV